LRAGVRGSAADQSPLEIPSHPHPNPPPEYRERGAEAGPARRDYILALVLFLCALLSKTVTATLPAAILLVIWWKRGRLAWRDVVPLLPFFALGLALGGVTGYLERSQVGARGVAWVGITPAHRLLIASHAVGFYAGKLALPIRFTFIYPRWTIDPRDLVQWFFPAALLAVLLTLWLLRHRLGRGPLVGVLFFIGTLVPALGFVNVYPMRYSFVADHFQYLASIGLIALFAAAVKIHLRRLACCICPLIIATLVFLSCRRGFAYANRETLWRNTIARNPSSWMAHTNLGHALHARGDDDGAWREYQEALRLAPDVPDTHLDAAFGFAIHGDYERAVEECQRSIAIDPTFAPAYATLAKALLSQGKAPEAEAAARRATELQPNYPDGHAMLARALDLQGRLFEAAAEYDKALALNPDDVQGHLRLAEVLVRLHRGPGAIEHYRAGLALDPENAPAWTTLGYLLLNAGQPQDAAGCFERALRIDPSLGPAKVGLQRTGGNG